MARGSPTALSLGPGFLFIAPLGTTEPPDLSSPGPAGWTAASAAWVAMGYTDAGSEFDYQLNADQVLVAEELDPISNNPTSRVSSVKFVLAQITLTNLKAAWNGGVVTTGTGIVTFEPPDLGTEVRAMIGFESEDHTERWVFRQCFQLGAIAIPRQKGAAKAVIPVEFTLEKPATGARLFKAVLATPQRS